MQWGSRSADHFIRVIEHQTYEIKIYKQRLLQKVLIENENFFFFCAHVLELPPRKVSSIAISTLGKHQLSIVLRIDNESLTPPRLAYIEFNLVGFLRRRWELQSVSVCYVFLLITK